jgi:hypothetical protein
MSSVKSSRYVKSEVVIVRSYGDEPTLLKAVVIYGDRVEVVEANPDLVLSYPRRLVCRYDEELYGELRAAHENGQADRLKEIWLRAEWL